MKIVTMQNLLKNPSGPYSAYFARRDLTIANLEDRYATMIKDKKEFKLEIFKEKDTYLFFFKVPSEKYEKIHYDVVIQFSPITTNSKTDFTLSNYSVKLFSNSPNFLFTYTYVYNQDGILINFLKEKINDRALTEPPNVRNPIQSYGFEKSVYYALLYIKYNRLNVKSALDSKASKLDIKKLLKAIDTTDEKLKQYNREKRKDVDAKKLEKSQKKVAKKSVSSYNRKVELANRPKSKKRNMKHDMTKSMKHVGRKK